MKICYHNDIPSLNLLNDLMATSTFMVMNQRLPAAVWRALSDCLSLFAEKQISRVHIQRTIVDDKYFPELLENLIEHSEIQSLTFSQVTLGPATIAVIAKMCNRLYGLNHLTLYECNFTGGKKASLAALLVALSDVSIHLSKLSLIMMKMTEYDLSALKQLLEATYTLRDLDISYNQVAP